MITSTGKRITVPSPVTLQIIWFSMQITPLLFLITMFVMDYMSLVEAVNPDIAEYFHIVIIAIIPAVLYLKKITEQVQN